MFCRIFLFNPHEVGSSLTKISLPGLALIEADRKCLSVDCIYYSAVHRSLDIYKTRIYKHDVTQTIYNLRVFLKELILNKSSEIEELPNSSSFREFAVVPGSFYNKERALKNKNKC